MVQFERNTQILTQNTKFVDFFTCRLWLHNQTSSPYDLTVSTEKHYGWTDVQNINNVLSVQIGGRLKSGGNGVKDNYTIQT